jgi:hypothetical protein
MHTNFVCVKVHKPLVWVHSDNDISHTRIWFAIAVSLFQVVKNGSLNKERDKGEVSEKENTVTKYKTVAHSRMKFNMIMT